MVRHRKLRILKGNQNTWTSLQQSMCEEAPGPEAQEASAMAAKVTTPVPSVRGGRGEGRKKRELWWGQDTWRGFLSVWPHFTS